MTLDVVTGYHPGCIGRVTELHATYYSATAGFDVAFEAKVARELAAFCETFDDARDGLWFVVEGERIEGSIAIDGSRSHGEGAHLRWFIVSDRARGRGFGQQLLREALAFVDARGYARTCLWTFEGLAPARHLYDKHGFRLAESRLGHQWGKPVTEQRLVRERPRDQPQAHDATPAGVAVDFDDLESALEWVSADGALDNQAFVSKATGAIHYVSADGFGDDDLPDDLDDATQYWVVPHRHDLDLGRALVLRYVREELPDDVAAVHEHFRRRGAYARFKALLERRGHLQRWYDYGRRATERALVEWAAECGFRVVRPPRPAPASRPSEAAPGPRKASGR